MNRLIYIPAVILILAVGSPNLYAESQNRLGSTKSGDIASHEFAKKVEIKNLMPIQDTVVFGTESYKDAETTVDVLFESNANAKLDKIRSSLTFQHSLTNLRNEHIFSLSFLGCTNFEASNAKFQKFLNFCAPAENTNLVITQNTAGDSYNLKFSNPTYGNAQISFNLNSDHFETNGDFNLKGISVIEPYNKLYANVSVDDLSIDFKLQKRAKGGMSGTASISDDVLQFEITDEGKIKKNELNLPDQLISKIEKFTSLYEEFLELKTSSYYFGGTTVHQGQILKEDNFSFHNKFEPTNIEGYKVIGSGSYRGRDIIVMKHILKTLTKDQFVEEFIENSNVNNERLEQELSKLDYENKSDGVIFVDKNLGVPIYNYIISNQKFSFPGKGNFQITFNMMMDTKFVPGGELGVKHTQRGQKLVNPSDGSIELKLENLQRLLENGQITKSEAAKKRQQILDSL